MVKQWRTRMNTDGMTGGGKEEDGVGGGNQIELCVGHGDSGGG